MPLGAAQPLPQATVKMGGTQPLGTGMPAPNIRSTAAAEEEEWEQENPDAGMLGFAIAGLVFALGVLVVQILIMTTNTQ